MTIKPNLPTCRVEYRQGGSDKYYELAMRSDRAHLFSVRAKYGRIGSLQGDYDIATDVPRLDADAEYYSQLCKKIGKGYNPTGRFTIDATGEVLRSLIARLGRKRGDVVARLIPFLTPEQIGDLVVSDVVDMLQNSNEELRLIALTLLPAVSPNEAPAPKFRRTRAKRV